MGAAALAVLLGLAACQRPAEPGAAPARAGDWLEFEGNWNASGTRRTLVLGPQRRASLLDLQGTLLLSGPSRPGAGFRGEIIALSDSASGLVGRAVWIDERGDEVYSELRGEGTATRNRIHGTFVGGSGRYAGASGSYEFSWQYFLNTEEGVIQGRADALKGRVHLGGPGAASAPPARSASAAGAVPLMAPAALPSGPASAVGGTGARP